MIEPDQFFSADILAQADKLAAQQREQNDAELREQVAAAQAQAHQPHPNSTLPFPPGFVGYVAQYVYQQAPRPVAEVAIVAALGLMAGIVGRNWHIPGSGLNLYVVLVARSAIGKEAMHSGISKIIGAAARVYPQAGNHVDFSDYVSGPALLKGSAQNQCFVNVAGEIGHKFVSMADNRDASMRSLQKVMLTLYDKSGPGSVAGGISYSSQENNVESVLSVAFSLIGETTPGTFYESITDTMMRNGFMSRFCVIEYTGDRPARNVAASGPPPQDLLDHIIPIIRQAGLAAATNAFQEVAFSEPAKALLDRFDEECDDAIRAAGDDENLRQLWNRAHLKALRVAALLAVGDHYLNPFVSLEQAEWSVSLIRHGIAAFDRRIRTGEVGEGSDGGREQKVLELCGEFLRLPDDKLPKTLKHGKAMQDAGIVPRNYLQQRTQRLAAFEKHKLGHTAALNMAIKSAMTNGSLIEVKKEALSEQFSFFGQAYRVLNLG